MLSFAIDTFSSVAQSEEPILTAIER